MDIERYGRGDSLAKLELENLYNSSSEKERIQITKKFVDKNLMLPQWAELTIKKGGSQEKIVLARYWYFSGIYPEYQVGDELVALLKNDGNILVRCALYENQNFLSREDQIQIFQEANHTERLALVRNEEVAQSLILKTYDINNNDFKLSDDERKELIFAFCSINKERIKKINKPLSYAIFVSGRSDFYGDLYDKAFELNSKIPGVALVTFRNLPCSVSKILEIYKKIKNNKEVTNLRAAIVDSVPKPLSWEQERQVVNEILQAPYDSTYDLDTSYESAYKFDELYREGLSDEDKWIRQLSAMRGIFTEEEIKNLLDRNDESIIVGLMSNNSLGLDSLNLIATKIHSDEFKYNTFIDCYRGGFEKLLKIAKGEKDLEDIEDFSKESYKVTLSFRKYFNDTIEDIRKQIKTIYWVVLVIIIILIFFRR